MLKHLLFVNEDSIHYQIVYITMNEKKGIFITYAFTIYKKMFIYTSIMSPTFTYCLNPFKTGYTVKTTDGSNR